MNIEDLLKKTTKEIVENEKKLQSQHLLNVLQGIRMEYQNQDENARFCQHVDNRIKWQTEFGVNVMPCGKRVIKPSMLLFYLV